MNIEVVILAAGLSTRMGDDKTRVRIHGAPMLSLVRTTASSMGLPVRVIRRDHVRRCGPLGGIITGFRRSRANALLFLACDMPFVTEALLRRVLRASRHGERPVFAKTNEGFGFPFLLPRRVLPEIEEQLRREAFSLQQLAARVRAVPLRVAAVSVFNINTPEDLASAEKTLRR